MSFPSLRSAPENPLHHRSQRLPAVAALFVAKEGCYFNLDGVDAWDLGRDARLYAGPHPVVAHPPCQLWTRFAHVNFARWGGEHNRPGNDGGCFASALAAVRRWGGVLEHPAFSDAWKAFGLPRPEAGQWRLENGDWVCEVWQSAYGHKARKRTWLLYSGQHEPPALRWDRPEGSHQIGFHDQRGKSRNKPTISGKAASATPPEFRDVLISIARTAHDRIAALSLGRFPGDAGDRRAVISNAPSGSVLSSAIKNCSPDGGLSALTLVSCSFHAPTIPQEA